MGCGCGYTYIEFVTEFEFDRVYKVGVRSLSGSEEFKWE